MEERAKCLLSGCGQNDCNLLLNSYLPLVNLIALSKRTKSWNLIELYNIAKGKQADMWWVPGSLFSVVHKRTSCMKKTVGGCPRSLWCSLCFWYQVAFLWFKDNHQIVIILNKHQYMSTFAVGRWWLDILWFQGPLLLTWINFNPSMDK